VVLLAAAVGLLGCSSGDDGGDRADGRARTSTTTLTTTTVPTTGPSADGSSSTGPSSTASPDNSAWANECRGIEPLQEGRAELTSNGTIRPYLVALPPDFDPTEPTPVIVDLHGYGSNMDEQAAYSRLPAEGADRGYVVVTPDGSGDPKGWDLGGGDDDKFIVDLLDVVDARMCVDPERVFVAGMSAGSALGGFLVCRHPERFAAAAMVAATVPPACPDDVRRPVIMFHGTADAIVPYDGGPVRSAGAGGRAAPSVETTAESWAGHDGCGNDLAVERIGADVIRRTWPGCRDGTAVQLYTIEEGGHTWPGAIDLASIGIENLGSTTHSIDATKLILDFFDAHPTADPRDH
jgi:polyhydroxybutyrate depolymerase